MGADLCLEYLYIKKTKKPDWKKGLAKINALEKLWNKQNQSEDMIQANEELFGFDVSIEEAIDTLKDDLKDLKSDVKSGYNRRDVTSIIVGTYKVYFTGGMTWGDDPSNSYASFRRLSSCGVTKACGFAF